MATFVAMHRSLYRYFINLEIEDEHSGATDWLKSKVRGIFASQIESPERIEMPTYPFLITMGLAGLWPTEDNLNNNLKYHQGCNSRLGDLGDPVISVLRGELDSRELSPSWYFQARLNG